MTWLPGFARDESIRGAGGGSALPGPKRGVIHTTEGGWDSAMAVFRSRMVAPHVMVDPATRRRVQFLPLDRSAYALVNAAGGVDTNRAGTVLQVEVVGFAERMADLPDDQLEWLATDVVRPMSAAVGITGAGLRCYGADAGWTLATPGARQRLSYAAWSTFSGWCGHQHVPENSHWDPGALDLPRITQIAYQGEDDVTVEELQAELVKADERAKAREQAMLAEIARREKRHNAAARERDAKLLATLERIATKLGA